MTQYAKVDKRTGKITEVARQRMQVPPNEQSQYDVQEVNDTAAVGDTASEHSTGQSKGAGSER